MAITNNTSDLNMLLEKVDTWAKRTSFDPILQTKTVTPSSVSQTVIADKEYDGLAKVIVKGDTDLLSENIKIGTNIFGIEGSYEKEDTEQQDIKALVTRNITGCVNKTITTIGSNAFAYCASLTSAIFPACTYINKWAFRSCTSLTTVNFPKCTTIGGSAFEYCTSLTSVSFPVCEIIGTYAFGSCSSLVSASFPECININYGAFEYCSSLTSVNFPACTNIGSWAFSDCSSLTTVSFPACENIDNGAFSDCYNLTSLYLTGSYLCTLSNSNAFSYTPINGYSTYAKRYGSIYVPQSLLASYQAATNWVYFRNRFVGINI